MLTLVGSTLTVEAHSVVDEVNRDKDQSSTGNAFALSNGMRLTGRLTRSMLAALPSTLIPLWLPYVTVSPYSTSPRGHPAFATVGNVHFTGWHV